MIKRIEIKNFQAHKDTVLDFDKGVNVITGESDNGKSAILRAMRWVIENYPSGTNAINSRWNTDFKEPMSVKIYTDKGWIERVRDKTRNGYIISDDNGERKLMAIGQSVPPDVTAFFGITDVNLQWQLDPPYLLSKTPGEASKYLNQIVHLDSIDITLAAADSDKRSLSSEQKVVERDIEKLKEEVEAGEWIDEAQNVYDRCAKLDEIVQVKNKEIMTLDNSIDNYNEWSKNITDTSEINKIISQIESVEIPDYSMLDNSISVYQDCQNKIVDTSQINEVIAQIESVEIPDYSDLEKSIELYKTEEDVILKCNNDIKELKEKLPNVCPLCGAPITEV